MSETTKWRSPTFPGNGNMASCNPRTKAHVSLVFDTGASVPGDHPRLEGGGGTARHMRFNDMAHAEAVADAWCASRD